MRTALSASAAGASGGASRCARPELSRPMVLMATAPCTRPCPCQSASRPATSASTRSILACGTPPLAAAAIALNGLWPASAGMSRRGKVAEVALIQRTPGTYWVACKPTALAPGRHRGEQPGKQGGVQRAAMHVGLQGGAIGLVGPPVAGVRTGVEAERQVGPGSQAARGHGRRAAFQPGIEYVHDVAAAGPL